LRTKNELAERGRGFRVDPPLHTSGRRGEKGQYLTCAEKKKEKEIIHAGGKFLHLLKWSITQKKRGLLLRRSRKKKKEIKDLGVPKKRKLLVPKKILYLRSGGKG